MSQKTYILCPGQGAQYVGMGKDAPAPFFDTAARVLGFDLATICLNGPDDRLNQTDISQPAIYVTSVASFTAAAIPLETITTCAGLSLGEYTALHLAGVFSFEDGLRLVAARGRYMQEAATASPSGMVAIMGADEPAIRALCQKAAQGDVLSPANFNAPGQIVVSGDAAACQRILAEAESAGLKALPLKVAGAFHSSLMQPAADKMRLELDKVPFAPPRFPVYSNVTAAPHADAASIKARLVDQITHPVRWEQTMNALVSGGEAKYIELAPGRTLAGLAKRINRRLPIESLDKKPV